jgi:8-oxo-dGTP pyrophosphatase MutT (NUDIX family)
VTHERLGDTPEDPVVSARETVYRGAVWDVVRETFDYGDGELTRDFVNHTGASAVVALNEDDEVLLLRQYRHPVRSRNWELPAGLLDQPGEDPLECARRELAEEASYQATEWTRMCTLNVSPGGSNELIHIFLARGLAPIEHDYERTGEEADLEVQFWPLSEAVAAAVDGRIHNQISVTGLLFAHVWPERH